MMCRVSLGAVRTVRYGNIYVEPTYNNSVAAGRKFSFAFGVMGLTGEAVELGVWAKMK
jgi:hypothetical protein